MSNAKAPNMDDYMSTLSSSDVKNNIPKKMDKPMKLRTISRPQLNEGAPEELKIRRGLVEDYEIAKSEESSGVIVETMLVNEYSSVSEKIKKVPSKQWKSMVMSSIPSEYLSEFNANLDKLDDAFNFYEQGWSDCSDKIYTWITTTGKKYAEKGYDVVKGKATPNKNIIATIKEFYKFLEVFMSRNTETSQDRTILNSVKKINEMIG